MDPLFAAYLSFALLFAATPGATTALVMRNTLAGGGGEGLRTAAGAAVANSTYAASTALGLASLLARWPDSLTWLRLGGAFYLAAIGIDAALRGLRPSRDRARRGADQISDTTAAAARAARDPRTPAFRQGLLFNLLNPSIAAFYLSAVPSFLPPHPSRARIAAMAAAHVSIAFACHATWAMALHGVRRVFDAPGPRRALDLLTAAALLGLAARILLHAR